MAEIRTYRIVRGDTIQQVARREVGTANGWWTLAEYNGLDYPYIDTSGTDHADKRVLGAGDTLLVPMSDTAAVVRDLYRIPEGEDDAALLGVDLEIGEVVVPPGGITQIATYDLVPMIVAAPARLGVRWGVVDESSDVVLIWSTLPGAAGRIVPAMIEITVALGVGDFTPGDDLDGDSASGDLRLVSGMDNLVSALRRRLLSLSGELAYHPEYGTHLYQQLGRPADAVVERLVEMEVRQAILSDPRIESVESLVAELSTGGHIHVEASVVVIGEQRVQNLVLNG